MKGFLFVRKSLILVPKFQLFHIFLGTPFKYNTRSGMLHLEIHIILSVYPVVFRINFYLHAIQKQYVDYQLNFHPLPSSPSQPPPLLSYYLL